MLFSLHEFESFWVFSFRLVSSFKPLWSGKTRDMILMFLNLLRLLFLSYHVVYLWEFSMCIWKNVYFASLRWKVLCISVKSISSRVSLSAMISLLTLCLEDLSIVDRGVLESPTISVLLSISFVKSLKIFLIYLGASMLGAYMYIMFMSS